jgi:hypothetical protein
MTMRLADRVPGCRTGLDELTLPAGDTADELAKSPLATA